MIGGRWGPALLAAIARAFARAPRSVPVEAAAVVDEPALTAARAAALRALRDAVVAASPRGSPLAT